MDRGDRNGWIHMDERKTALFSPRKAMLVDVGLFFQAPKHCRQAEHSLSR
jgi:hypothetical protein